MKREALLCEWNSRNPEQFHKKPPSRFSLRLFLFRIFLTAFLNVLSRIPQKQWFQTAQSKQWFKSMRWLQTSQKSCTESVSLIFDGRHFLASHRPPVASYHPFPEFSETDFETGKCRLSFNLWKERTCQRAVSSSASFCFFIGRH